MIFLRLAASFPLFFLLVSGAMGQDAATKQPQPAPAVVCPMLAKVCPDGSYVMPSGPHCEVPACPTATSQPGAERPPAQPGQLAVAPSSPKTCSKDGGNSYRAWPFFLSPLPCRLSCTQLVDSRERLPR